MEAFERLDFDPKYDIVLARISDAKRRGARTVYDIDKGHFEALDLRLRNLIEHYVISMCGFKTETINKDFIYCKFMYLPIFQTCKDNQISNSIFPHKLQCLQTPLGKLLQFLDLQYRLRFPKNFQSFCWR
jgi:hypothetical protein